MPSANESAIEDTLNEYLGGGEESQEMVTAAYGKRDPWRRMPGGLQHITDTLLMVSSDPGDYPELVGAAAFRTRRFCSGAWWRHRAGAGLLSLFRAESQKGPPQSTLATLHKEAAVEQHVTRSEEGTGRAVEMPSARAVANMSGTRSGDTNEVLRNTE